MDNNAERFRNKLIHVCKQDEQVPSTGLAEAASLQELLVRLCHIRYYADDKYPDVLMTDTHVLHILQRTLKGMPLPGETLPDRPYRR